MHHIILVYSLMYVASSWYINNEYIAYPNELNVFILIIKYCSVCSTCGVYTTKIYLPAL